MPDKNTLTPIIVFLKIERQGSTLLDTENEESNLGLLSVDYSPRVNDVAQATVSIFHKNEAGRQLLDNLFPSSGNSGTYLSEATIKIKGHDTKLSTIKNDIELFKGTIIGYGQSVSLGNSSYQVNLRGVFFQYNQIPVLVPGLHTSSTSSLGVNPLYLTGSASVNIVDVLLRKTKIKNNGFEMMQEILTNYSDVVSKGVEGQFTGRAFRKAVEAFRLSDTASNVLLDEFKKLVIPDEGAIRLNLDPDIKAAIMRNIVHKYSSNFRATWWNLLLEILEQFGLDIINLGSKVYGIPRSPLISPPENINNIPAEDIVQLDSGDFPFFTPTRCILMTNNSYSINNPNRLNVNQVALAPDSSDLLPQEEATGVFTIVEYAPGIAGYSGNIFGKPFADNTNQKELSVTRKGKSKVKSKVQELIQSLESKGQSLNDFYDTLASYLLMKNKFLQRSGYFSTRFRPDIVPGIPCRVQSPTDSRNFDAYVMSVQHSISSQGATAISTVVVNNIRYDGELNPNPFPNPIYPSFNVDSVIDQIKQDFPGIV